MMNTPTDPQPARMGGDAVAQAFREYHAHFPNMYRPAKQWIEARARELSAHGGDGDGEYDRHVVADMLESYLRELVTGGIDGAGQYLPDHVAHQIRLLQEADDRGATQQPASGDCRTCKGRGWVDEGAEQDDGGVASAIESCPDCAPATAAHGGSGDEVRVEPCNRDCDCVGYCKAGFESSTGEGSRVPIGHCTHQTALALLGRAYTAGQANEGYYPIKEALYDACAMDEIASTPPSSASDAEVGAVAPDVPMILWAMRNWASVADSCAVTEGHAPACIRTWADLIEVALTRSPAAVGVTNPTEISSKLVDEPMVMRACDAYDSARTGEDMAEYPAMHAAITAAIAQQASAREGLS